MKIKFLITAVLMGCFVAAWALTSSGLNGTWTGTLTGREGEQFPVRYTLKADGDKLIGTGATPNGDIPISQATMSGPDFSFIMNFNGMTIKNTGKYYPAADSIALDVELYGTRLHATLKRSNP